MYDKLDLSLYFSPITSKTLDEHCLFLGNSTVHCISLAPAGKSSFIKFIIITMKSNKYTQHTSL